MPRTAAAEQNFRSSGFGACTKRSSDQSGRARRPLRRTTTPWGSSRRGSRTRTAGRPPTLADVTVIQAQERPKWRGHPFLEGRSDKMVSGATIHDYVRSLKTFGAWLEAEGYVHRLAA